MTTIPNLDPLTTVTPDDLLVTHDIATNRTGKTAALAIKNYVAAAIKAAHDIASGDVTHNSTTVENELNLQLASGLGIAPAYYGAAGNGTTDDSTAVNLAIATGKTLIINKPTKISGVVTATKVIFGQLGKFILTSGTVLTISEIQDTRNQIFDTSAGGTVSLVQSWVRPDWWGDIQNTINYAVNALPATGGVVKLSIKRYKPNNHAYTFATTNTNYLSKDNVTIEGEKTPNYSQDYRTLVGGSIIEGMFLIYANNIELKNLGVDSGKTVVDFYNAGVVSPGNWEGLLLTYPDNATAAASPTKRKSRLHNVVALGYSPTTSSHAFIAGEGYTDVVCTGEISGCYGFHGVVIKCSNFKADLITAYCNGGEGLIIKSDAGASSVAQDIQIDRLSVSASGASGYSPYAVSTTGVGIMLNPQQNNINNVQIGTIDSRGHPVGFQLNYGSGTKVIDSLRIGKMITDTNSSYGVSLTGGAGSSIIRSSIGELHTRNSPAGVITGMGTPCVLNLGMVSTVNGVVSIEADTYPQLSIESVQGESCSDAVLRLKSSSRPKIGTLTVLSGTPAAYSSSGGGIVPSLSNGWTQFGGGNEPFSVNYIGGGIEVTGLLIPGTSNVVCRLPFWAKPANSKRFSLIGKSAVGGIVMVPVVLDPSTGDVVINEVVGGFANCTDWLSLSGISYTL